MKKELVESAKKSNLKVPNVLPEVVGVDSVEDMDCYITHFLGISKSSKEIQNKERKLMLIEGLNAFPKAAIWSLILSSVIFMEGYNTNLIGGYYAFPSIQEKYGKYYPGTGYKALSKWRTALNMANGVADILVALTASSIAERYGFKKTMKGSLFLAIGLLYVVFLSDSIGVLAAGEVLLRIPLGVFQTLAICYAMEICPFILRIYLTMYINSCWLIGQLISLCILKGIISNDIKYVNKLPFALQWYWLIPIMIAIFLAPESPRWLAKKHKVKEAKASFTRLLAEDLPNRDILADRILKEIQIIFKEEDIISSTDSYWDCFKGNDFNRTRIASAIWLIQNITGTILLCLSTYFYELASHSSSILLSFSIAQFMLVTLGKACSSIVSQNAKKYQIYFAGLCVQFFILIIIGVLGFAHSASNSWIALFLLIFIFVHDSIARPVYNSFVQENSTSRLRTKTNTIAGKISHIGVIIMGIINPHVLVSSNGCSKAKSGFLCGSIALTAAIWCYFELLEMKGRKFAELDTLLTNSFNIFKPLDANFYDTDELLENIGGDIRRDSYI